MGNFTLDLTRLVKKTQVSIDTVVQKSTHDVFRAVILKTPVDTGRARMNWIASSGNYGTNTVSGFDKSGSATIARMAGTVLSTKAGGIVYLTNSLPYIRFLEYGRGDGRPGSMQAPQGMVRITITEYQNFLTKAVREVKR